MLGRLVPIGKPFKTPKVELLAPQVLYTSPHPIQSSPRIASVCDMFFQLPVSPLGANCPSIFDRSQHLDLQDSQAVRDATFWKSCPCEFCSFRGKINWVGDTSDGGQLVATKRGAAQVVGGKHGFGHPWHFAPHSVVATVVSLALSLATLRISKT